MKYFAGLDGSLEETAIWVVDETGQIIKEARAASEPEARDALLSNHGLLWERLGLEASSLTAWLHRPAAAWLFSLPAMSSGGAQTCCFNRLRNKTRRRRQGKTSDYYRTTESAWHDPALLARPRRRQSGMPFAQAVLHARKHAGGQLP